MQAHDGTIDNGKTLKPAGARPLSDRWRLEKTPIAHHTDLFATPGLHSLIQNMAGTHQLALSALLGCPIAHSARTAVAILTYSHMMEQLATMLKTAGARPMSDRRRLEKTPIIPYIDLSGLACVCFMNPILSPAFRLGSGSLVSRAAA